VWTAYLGWTNQLDRHRPLARWVLPLWLYVTVTGVLVYVLLYRTW
jgi:putative membrane protein